MLNWLKKFINSFFRFLFYPIYRKIEKIDKTIVFNTDLVLRVMCYTSYSCDKQRNKVIYTCITRNYDDLIQHNYINFDYDYVCYTDNAKLLKMGSYGVWKIKPLQFTMSDDIRINRWHKIHPHVLFPGYDESIYIDANIDVRTDILFDLILADDTIRIPIHNISCIYEEAINIIKSGKDRKECVEKMLDFLKKESFPKDYGLTENCIIYRKHNNKKVIAMMNMWWELIVKFSRRDQLSLSFVLWKFNISPYSITFPNVRHNDKNFIFHGKH